MILTENTSDRPTIFGVPFPVDQTLFHLINERWTNPALDLFVAAIGNVEIWTPLAIVIPLGLLIFGGFKGRAFIFCLLISLLVAEPFTRGNQSNALSLSKLSFSLTIIVT